MLSCFFFTDSATTEIYTLSLHDALPIWSGRGIRGFHRRGRRTHRAASLVELRTGAAPRARHEQIAVNVRLGQRGLADRKSTRLNSSHTVISYAVFCLKKKNRITTACSRT